MQTKSTTALTPAASVEVFTIPGKRGAKDRHSMRIVRAAAPAPIDRAEVARRAERHHELCRARCLPNFAISGGCSSCGRNVFSHPRTDGSGFVSECPHCHRSFCD